MSRLSLARAVAGVSLFFVALGAGEARAAGWDCPNPDVPCAPPYEEEVLEQGPLWQRMVVHGYAADGDGQEYKAYLYVVQNEEGLASVPLPGFIVEDLATQLSPDATRTFIVHEDVVRELVISQKQGELTPALRAIAEPAGGAGFTTLGSACPNQLVVKGKTYNLNTTSSTSKDLGGGFTGSLSLSTGVQGSGTGEVHVQTKRASAFGFCVPYGVIFDKVRIHGGVTVDSTASLTGTVNYNYAWESPELAKPHLFSLDFLVGVVPVHIGFNLPITVGFDLQASVTGNVTFDGMQRAQGNFDYSCTLDGCGGNATYKLYNSQSPGQPTGSISGRVHPSLWAQAGLRGYLYNEWLAYAQVGVRPYLRGDLWGYAGNGCGDLDGNGVNEQVSALTFDLDWQVALTAQAAAFGKTPKRWDNLWSTQRNHIGFWNLGTSNDALRPLLGGATSVPVNASQAYTARMRPCWPYGDALTYSFNWGDATPTSGASAAPQTAATASHAWSSSGTKTLTLTAQRDSHGRTLGTSNSRAVAVSGMQLPSGAHSFTYNASNTNSAQQNTVDWPVTLAAGQTLAVGTCGMTGASFTGDTLLRLVGPGGNLVQSSDDACSGMGSHFTYAVPPGAGGTYTLRAGCYGSGSCGGKVVWTVSGALYYSASNTSGGTVNTANLDVALLQGETLSVGTCVVPGSSGTGDTLLRLNNGTGTQVAYSDDSSSDPSCGYLSYLQHTVPVGAAGTHQIRAGCYSANTCSGTVSYVITGP